MQCLVSIHQGKIQLNSPAFGSQRPWRIEVDTITQKFSTAQVSFRAEQRDTSPQKTAGILGESAAVDPKRPGGLTRSLGKDASSEHMIDTFPKGKLTLERLGRPGISEDGSCGLFVSVASAHRSQP